MNRDKRAFVAEEIETVLKGTIRILELYEVITKEILRMPVITTVIDDTRDIRPGKMFVKE